MSVPTAAQASVPGPPMVLVRFQYHLYVDRLHISLNNIYQSLMPNMSRLFKDPDSCNELLDNSSVIKMVQKIISEEMVSPKAIHTGSLDPISTMIDSAELSTEIVDKVVLPDGTLFIFQAEPNEKGLMKATIACEDDTHAGICAWYQNFVQACHDYGFYAHPLWCFRPDHGGNHGFTIGDGTNDDLPTQFEIAISRMSHPIFCLLSKKGMFWQSSRLHSIVRSCDGDGYIAIKSIIFKLHPAFYDQPSTLITSFP